MLFTYQRTREHRQWERQTEGEVGSSLSKEPNTGLDPGSLRS